MELWADVPNANQKRHKSKSPSSGSQISLERKHERCMELVADGQYSKATSALVSPGLVKRDDQSEKAM